MDSAQEVRPLNAGALIGVDKLIYRQLTVFSWIGSQWAGVAHLGLAEKGFGNEEVEIKEIDLRKFSHAQEKMEMLTQTNDKVKTKISTPNISERTPTGRCLPWQLHISVSRWSTRGKSWSIWTNLDLP